MPSSDALPVTTDGPPPLAERPFEREIVSGGLRVLVTHRAFRGCPVGRCRICAECSAVERPDRPGIWTCLAAERLGPAAPALRLFRGGVEVGRG